MMKYLSNLVPEVVYIYSLPKAANMIAYSVCLEDNVWPPDSAVAVKTILSLNLTYLL